VWWVSYDWKSLEACPQYDGPVCIDFYGRLHPKHATGTAVTLERTNLSKLITEVLMPDIERKTDHRLLFRKLGVCAADVVADGGFYQLDLFTDFAGKDERQAEDEEKLRSERRQQRVMLDIKKKYGKNAILKGMNLEKGATTIERNRQIGGHKA
jgi:DNA polymerase V